MYPQVCMYYYVYSIDEPNMMKQQQQKVVNNNTPKRFERELKHLWHNRRFENQIRNEAKKRGK